MTPSSWPGPHRPAGRRGNREVELAEALSPGALQWRRLGDTSGQLCGQSRELSPGEGPGDQAQAALGAGCEPGVMGVTSRGLPASWAPGAEAGGGTGKC